MEQNHLTLARNAKKINDAKKALECYKNAYIENPTCAEAKFYVAYFSLMDTKKLVIVREFLSFAETASGIVEDIKADASLSQEDQQILLSEILIASMPLPAQVTKTAREIYNLSHSNQDAVDIYRSAAEGIKMFFSLGDQVAKHFSDFASELSVELWKAGITCFEVIGYGMDGAALRQQAPELTQEYCALYAEKIRVYLPEFEFKQKKPSLIEKIMNLFKKK